MLKIGLNVTDAAIEKGILESLQKIGYTSVDYGILGDYATPHAVFSEDRAVWTKYYEDRKRLFASHGLTVGQTHGTFNTDFDVLGEVTDKIIAQFEKEIEATAILGSKYIVIHPIFYPANNMQKEKERERNLMLYRRFIPALKKFGVKIAIENMYVHDYARMRRMASASCSTPEDLKYYLDELGTECFTACLDTGHANIACINSESYVKVLGKDLRVLHANDNGGICDDHNAPYMGIVDWKKFVCALKEIGYDGVFNLELNVTDKYINVSKGVGEAYLKYAYDVTRALLEE